VSRALRIAAAGAALAALLVPATSLGQATPKQKAQAKKQQVQAKKQQVQAKKQQAAQQAGPTETIRLQTAHGWTFPDRGYVVQLPEKRALSEGDVTVSENGGDVEALAVSTPGGGKNFGTVLVIDASESMKGKPLADAMAGARAFAERNPDQALAVLAVSDRVEQILDFTTDKKKIDEALSTSPQSHYGTHIYDSIVEAVNDLVKFGPAVGRIVLLSDGQELGSTVPQVAALAAAEKYNVRVYTIGLQSRFFDAGFLKNLSTKTGGAYAEASSSADLEAIYTALGSKLANEYIVTYRSLLPPERKANVKIDVTGFKPAVATYVTPKLDFSPQGTFNRSWFDQVIVSPWLMIFVAVTILALLVFALLTAIDVRNRSIRRRMSQYVTVPTEDESRLRRAEVAAMLADTAQKTVGGQRWWQRFESDVELGGFRLSPLAIAGWTIVGGIAASLVATAYTQNLWWLLLGLGAPFVTRWLVSRRVRKKRDAFAEQLPDNLDVLAGAMRTGHSTMGALSVMVDSADEPSKSEFRRVVQDEQLGVPLDDALMVMARRMESYDAEQIALVMRLQREAGGNTAEVLDRVAEVIRGRMELRRLVNVLTAQARISRWILTGLPIFVFFSLAMSGGDYLDPLTGTIVGKIALAFAAIMILIGSFIIKKMAELDV